MPIIPVRSVMLGVVLVFAFVMAAFGQEECTGAKIFSSANCVGDAVSPDEKALFEAVNKYRSDNGLQPITLSVGLSILGNRRVLDLKQNMRTLTHSWSNCPYEVNDEKTWPCLLDSPTRLNTGYKGQAYETLYRSSRKVDPAAAIEAWKKSSLHTSIILNKGMFAEMQWDGMGVAIDGQFAALWFGHPPVK